MKIDTTERNENSSEIRKEIIGDSKIPKGAFQRFKKNSYERAKEV